MKDGESITITDLPDGVQYHVEEAEANQDGYTTSVSHADSTISAGGGAEAKFVNDKPGTSGHDKPSSGKTSVTARKEWKDTGENRPGYILVQLMRNSKAYGNPIYLRSENGWQYTWTNLNRDDQWSVQEVQVPDGYQVSVSYVGTVWTITNTKGDTPDKPNRPDTPDKPDTPDTPNLPDTPTQPDQPVTPVTPDRPDQPGTPDRTPKTGDETHLPLWLTLMGTSLVGLIFSIWEIRKNKRNKHIR